MFPALFGKKSREALSESKQKSINGNFAGDGWQNGGTLVIDKGGKTLLAFRQESPGEHVDLNEVLKALGIEGRIEVTPAVEEMQCDDGACALPNKSDPSKVECNDEACAIPEKESIGEKESRESIAEKESKESISEKGDLPVKG